MAKREYVLRIIRDEDLLYMPPHAYRVGTGQPFETLVRLLINESYDPNITVEVISERDVEPGRPMTGPHPHNVPEVWRDDGKCLVKSCGVYRAPSTDVEPEGHVDVSPQTHPFT